MSDSNKTTTTKPAQAFREAAEKSTAQAKDTFEKVSTGVGDATTQIGNSYSTAVDGAKQYNTKFMEFAQANTEAAFAFAQKLWTVKSPSEFVQLSMEHSRAQRETLTSQTKELSALAQKVTLDASEPLKQGMKKALG